MNLSDVDAAKVVAQHQIRPQLNCDQYSGLNSQSAVFRPAELSELETPEGKKSVKKVRKGPK